MVEKVWGQVEEKEKDGINPRVSKDFETVDTR